MVGFWTSPVRVPFSCTPRVGARSRTVMTPSPLSRTELSFMRSARFVLRTCRAPSIAVRAFHLGRLCTSCRHPSPRHMRTPPRSPSVTSCSTKRYRCSATKLCFRRRSCVPMVTCGRVFRVISRSRNPIFAGCPPCSLCPSVRVQVCEKKISKRRGGQINT